MSVARRLVACVPPVHDEADCLRVFPDALVTAPQKRPDLDVELVRVGSRLEHGARMIESETDVRPTP